MYKVLIGTTVKQDPDILEAYLDSLKRLQAKDNPISYCFIDDNDDPKSSSLISAFATEHDAVILPSEAADTYQKDEHTHYWTEALIWKVAALKNKIISYAIEQKMDYIFFIDSDIVLHPATLEQLLASQKDIISCVFWTQWQPGTQALPQVWLRDEYEQFIHHRGESLSDAGRAERHQEFLEQMRKPGIYEVGGLGACTLISSEALYKGVHFGEIPNLSFWGEDRHFCIRAAALGIPLYVDTHYPAFHLYRQTDLAKLPAFRWEHNWPGYNRRSTEETRNTLTLSMIVKNESGRFLERSLRSALPAVNQAIIIDDHSTDNTIAICQNLCKEYNVPLKLIENPQSEFSNEVQLRKQQWQETIATHPDWILNLDADEVLDSVFLIEKDQLLNQAGLDLYSFRLYDFWDEEHYREDQYWQAHRFYRPFLLRYQPAFPYEWRETPVHCGRFPENIFQLPNSISTIRIKHFGWARAEDRLRKYERYRQQDPEAIYGQKEQYESILDPNPNLIKWMEVSSFER
ncbi:glycosyltransferase [Terribacillus sp. AE2B 122]|uniref:glycosyltransferase n=1 Tax=Terribacillus sp. AE2B 122 TaxID=1331902 RepID=UPI0014403CC5|nr:glycosyltransferase [Terribacillus sp. AE2B 122]VVM34807.1 Glycosyltransferases involved in cell wall biogenesis [Terribacillus sp. AE2B 122]